MDFNILSIRGYGERSDPYLYPIIDERGHFIVERDDHSGSAVAFSNVEVKRNAVTVFESEHALDGKLFITDSRIVLICENYQSGGIIWVGGLVGALLASAASDAMAKQRTEGTVLTGHIRYEWLNNVIALSEKLPFGFSDETIVFTYRGSEYSTWTVTVSLKDAKGIAEKTSAEIKRRYSLFTQGSSDEKAQAKEPYQLPAVGATRPASATKPASTAQASETSGFMYCTQCGRKIRESAAFCRYCGAKQSRS